MPQRERVLKRKRSRSKGASFEGCWKPVSIHTNDDVDQSGDFHSREEDIANNHYDNPKLRRQASKDLPVKPGEEIAFFYGLEVLDSSLRIDLRHVLFILVIILGRSSWRHVDFSSWENTSSSGS